jgi:hypothetical protein
MNENDFYLISLSAEGNFLAVFHALVNLNFQNLPFPVDFSSIALLASQLGIDSFTLTLAFATHGLDLLHHARTELLNSNLHAGSSACWTTLHGSGFTADT